MNFIINTSDKWEKLKFLNLVVSSNTHNIYFQFHEQYNITPFHEDSC